MTPVFLDLSARVKLRVKGGDCFRFLNGQITNDLRKATAGSTIQASILSAKGKLSAHVFVAADGEAAFLLDADEQQRESLPARLDRYIIADAVEIEDVTEQFSLFRVVGAPVPEGVAAAKATAANRLGTDGTDVWVDQTQTDQVRRELGGSGAVFLDAGAAEVLRIEMGIPRWGCELTEDIIPVEANLEEAAIDYGKGCYIGQEVISRMKISGQTNKRLRGLISMTELPLVPGNRLWSRGEPGKDAGWIASATHSARLGKEIALGYVKRGFNDNGSQLLAGLGPDDSAAPVTVVPLPFI